MKTYKPHITAVINKKGVLDVDTVKGCVAGMSIYPCGGCYGLCYAAKIAKTYGYDFTKSVSRSPNSKQLNIIDDFCNKDIYKVIKNHNMSWFRIGTMGDPSHNWELTTKVCEWLCSVKTPVIVTKHWIEIPQNLIEPLRSSKIVVNTSISALDTNKEIADRINQFKRLNRLGIKSILRVVSCDFGDNENGRSLTHKQDFIMSHTPIIDTPLRIPKNDKRVLSGDIIVSKKKDLNSEQYISIKNNETYIGHCSNCPDQCGINL